MAKELFSTMELDALGEMMNISLGSSATAVSNMLNHRVNITTPKVSVVAVDEFELGELNPAMAVQIKYVEGLDGSNIMLLKRKDVKTIVDILLGSETPDDEFELNDLTLSAVCEVMNQMMGSAATAMSDFLGFPVNISTPNTFELTDLDEFKKTQFPPNEDKVVTVRFFLKIEDALESEFMNVLSVPLAKELLAGLGLGGEEEEAEPAAPAAPAPAPAPAGDHKMSQEEIEAMMSGMGGGAPAAPAAPKAPAGDHKMSQEEIEAMMSGMNGGAPAAPAAPKAPAGDHKMSQEEIEAMMSGMGGGAPAAPAQPMPNAMPQMPQTPPMPQMAPDQNGQMPPYGYMGYPPMYYPGYGYPMQPPIEPKKIETQPLEIHEMPMTPPLGKEQSENLDLIMEVPLQVTVEIGRTRRKVQDILEFSKGSLVVLDKLAGDQVDLFVNGKCIAKGDVVVVDDNFGVRITEIVQKNGMESIAPKK